MTDEEPSSTELLDKIARLEAENAELRRAERRISEIVETAPDALVVVDDRGQIVFANRRVEELFGYRRQELVGQPLDSLLPERYRDGHEDHRRHYSARPAARSMGSGLELYARRRDGGEFPVEISLSPIRIGEQSLVASAIRDASERRDIERRLREARGKAEAATAEKTRFIAAASHDLRQPLQAAAIYLDLLGEGALAPEVMASTARKAKDCVDSLRALLNKVLHISKLDAGAVNLRRSPFRVHTLFERLEAQFGPIARSKGIQLRVRGSLESAISDPTLTAQILENLVSNAVRYTRQGRVLVGCRRRGAELRLQVWDSGPGIAEEDREKVFKAFYRVDESAADAAGIGLGLAIVRQISELLGHRVEVRSTPGRGSLFELVLPRVKGARSAPVEAPRVTTRPAEVLVAVLDDSPAIVDALSTVLEVAGNRVVSGTTVEAVVAELERADRTPDALLTDYRLTAGKSGLDALETLRARFGSSIPAIVLTGDSSFEALKRRAASDGFRVLAKPVDARELLAELESCLDAG